MADGALRGMEHMWEAGAQQVAGQGAAGEREQQGREEEGWLPEEVQGSQPPRWLDTSARACPRPSREERFKGKDPELDAAHFDQLWPKASWGWFSKQPRRERRGEQEGAEGRVGAGGVEEGRAEGRPRQGEVRAQGGGELVVRLSLQWSVPFPVEPAFFFFQEEHYKRE
ncbi:MAG: hypothetical protein ACT6RN_27685 [Agrobacterium sp.]|uniref:hypothetical protein n=1 Tax=Agrobacterium sp. TaxID=361 RepID=UPI004037D55E